MSQPIPANWQEKHEAGQKKIKAPAYLEYYSVVQLTKKTVKKKRKLIDDEASYLAAYARWQGFPEPLFLEYVSHLVESEVKERLNRISLPVSLWIHIFQPLLKLARVVGSK